MLFDFEDPLPLHSHLTGLEHDVKPILEPIFSPSSPSFVWDSSQSSPTDSGYYDSMDTYSIRVPKSSPPPDTQQFLANWINDPKLALHPLSSPIPIPWINDPELTLYPPFSPIPIPIPSSMPQSPSFPAPVPLVPFSAVSPFSPTEFAALHPLPRSMSPSSSQNHYSPQHQHLHFDAIFLPDTFLHTPSWASCLWEKLEPVPPSPLTHPSRHSLLRDTTARQRLPSHRGSVSPGQAFQSMSAPSTGDFRSPGMTRSYSRRAESAAVADDHDATVRRKKRSEDSATPPKVQDYRKLLLQTVS